MSVFLPVSFTCRPGVEGLRAWPKPRRSPFDPEGRHQFRYRPASSAGRCGRSSIGRASHCGCEGAGSNPAGHPSFPPQLRTSPSGPRHSAVHGDIRGSNPLVRAKCVLRLTVRTPALQSGCAGSSPAGRSNFRALRLAARTPGSQPGDTSSSLVGHTIMPASRRPSLRSSVARAAPR
jgi:hypothetical protein